MGRRKGGDRGSRHTAVKIVLVTYGSRGDVQPMLALSLALKSTGHEVLLVAPPERGEWVEQFGCPFHPLGSDVTSFIDGMGDAHSFRSAVDFTSYVRREVISQFDALPEIIAGADLAVGASLVFALSTVAEYIGVGYRYILFTPQLLPSCRHPFPAFKHQTFPQWYNRMTWGVTRMLDRFNLRGLINRKRGQLGLKPVKDAWLHILGKNVIVASDRAIAGVPEDAEPSVVQTGYLHLDQPARSYPGLEAFLRAGPPPVYAGFGSMPRDDQASNVPLIVRAARSAGRRMVIGRFWDEPAAVTKSEDVFFITKYPHLRLFPRMAAVIHHGGAGTTASSAVSGVPQIVVPHALDQYYWGHHVYRSRLGPKPIWRSRLTSQRLAEAISKCLSSDLIRQKTKAVSEEIKREKAGSNLCATLVGV